MEAGTVEGKRSEASAFHGGRLVAKRLKANGVSKVFTLSGGHLFSIYDGCREEGIDLIDTRHEATAAFAAEGWAKATREVGVCALTAGPGVTNGMSALASAEMNNSPLLVIGGRAPQHRWGQGSLQEIDHIPFVRPLCKMASTAMETAEIPGLVDEAIATATTPPCGPVFLDFPMDVVFMESELPAGGEQGVEHKPPSAGSAQIEAVAKLLTEAERPVIMAGTNLYWAAAEGELVELVEAAGIPTFLNGMARGCLPADHDLFFSRARSMALKGADLALVVGVPMDFRLGFGGSFGDETEIVQIDWAEPERDPPRKLAAELYGGIASTLGQLRQAALAAGAGPEKTKQWAGEVRAVEEKLRAAERDDLEDGRAPLHPMRIYKDLHDVLDRDATVIGDGGDFVSYAGKAIDSYLPGKWMDPGPFGCLGAGPGYAIAAKLARPDSQVCLLMGDGAFGFSGMEFDTMARHGLAVVAVIGNNGIWALEKHPMEFVYGYSVVADLRPGTRYDQVVEALGGHGELVERPEGLKPALERAFDSGLPACVNVMTDPTVVYPRKANLA